jgi:hypothetical protein
MFDDLVQNLVIAGSFDWSGHVPSTDRRMNECQYRDKTIRPSPSIGKVTAMLAAPG